MLSNASEYDKMNNTESQLWWYNILHGLVLTTIKKKFNSKDIAILDAACGTGGLIKVLTEEGFSNVQGFDVSDYAVSLAKTKTGKDVKVLDLKDVDSIYFSHSFDVIICNDALYFIGEEQLTSVLSQLMSLLKKDGILIINLPAFQFFKGMHDVSVAINERWTYSKFKKVTQGVFYDTSSINHEYWPFLLSPLILIARGWQRLQLKLNPGTKVVSDVQLPPFVLNKIFYNLTKWESHLPFSRWVGSSLFIIIYR